MARPVLATSAAFTGIAAVAGRDLLVADGAACWIDQAVSVLAGRHGAMGMAARMAVEARHSWARALAPLDAVLGVPAPVGTMEEQVSA